MEIFIIIALLLLVTFFMPWINFFRIGSFRDEIETLHKRIKTLERALYEQKEEPLSKAVSPAKKMLAAMQPVIERKESIKTDILEQDKKEREEQVLKTEQEPEVPLKELEVEKETVMHEAVVDSISSTSLKPSTKVIKKEKSSFEKNIATKLPVWIGSVSLIFAAFFLVKYSIEYGLLGPGVRTIISGLFASGLVVGGHFVSKRPNIANAARISQGLIGAGLVGLYVTLYAAINLFALINPVVGFVGMTVVTILAVVLSLRHGQVIAIFGLVGGLLTPAMVGADEPNAIALFAYLFLLFTGLFAALVRKGWWSLALFTLLGVFSWSCLWMTTSFVADDSLVLLLFTLGLSVVVLSVTGKRIIDGSLEEKALYSVHLLNIAAIVGGVITILWLSAKMTLGLFDWSMLGLFSLALIVLSYFQPSVYQRALYAKFITSLVLLFIWSHDASLMESLSVLAGMTVIYVGSATFMMRKVRDPREWATMQALSTLSLYLIAFVNDLAPEFLLDLPYFWGVLAFVLAALSIVQTVDIQKNYKADQTIQTYLVALFSVIATTFISVGLAIELPYAQLPLAIAAQIAATAWVYKYTEVSVLKKIMYALSLLFVLLNLEQVVLFLALMLGSIGGENPARLNVSQYVLDMPLLDLGVPALLLYLSAWLVMRVEKTDRKALHALFGTANILVFMTAYYLFRMVFHTGEVGEHIFAQEAGFVERGVLTIIIALFGAGIIEFTRRQDVMFLSKWGVFLFRMAMFRLVYFDLLMHNPYWSGNQSVGALPLLNGVSMTYGFGVLAAGWALYHKDLITHTDWMKKLYAGIAVASFFALTSLNVRQLFHGAYLDYGAISHSEFYTYSVVWLLSGLFFLAAGIKFDNKLSRMISLPFILLAICKVFLLDAAELDGLFRVFSFLGLGVSLIGLSFFYTRFVFKGADGVRSEKTEGQNDV